MTDELSNLLTAIDAAIRSEDPDAKGAFTSQEAAKAWGIAKPTAYVKLAAAVDAGLVEPCQAPKRTRFGYVRMTPCYRVVKQTKKGNK